MVMKYFPKINFVIFSLYIISVIGVMGWAMADPKFRSISYAPLRELFMPSPDPIELFILYSTEKEAWLEKVISGFEASDIRVNGRPIKVILEKTGSREMYLGILDDKYQPDVISPASTLQISILQDLSQQKYSFPIVNRNNQSECISVIRTPLVLVAWKERADVLWKNQSNEKLWESLYLAVTSTTGWQDYGHPEWGYVKFSHTDPTKSNSGFMTLLLLSYSYFNKTSGLTENDIISNRNFQEWIINFENSIVDFGDSTGTYMKEIVAYGPSKYDVVAVYESTAIEHLENAKGRYGELQIYYPPATIFSDHPFCILNAPWVTPEKREASKIFIEYLQTYEAQQIALNEHGFRPVNQRVDIKEIGSPFIKYASNGLEIDLPQEIQLPSGNTLDILISFWIRNIQK